MVNINVPAVDMGLVKPSVEPGYEAFYSDLQKKWFTICWETMEIKVLTFLQK